MAPPNLIGGTGEKRQKGGKVSKGALRRLTYQNPTADFWRKPSGRCRDNCVRGEIGKLVSDFRR